MVRDNDSAYAGSAEYSSPIPPGYRAGGVLLHVTSLPSAYGIGDIGPSAFTWVDFLAQAGQTWWQVLPLGPPGLGSSPYHALSSFAGNALLLSPERLIEEGLLRPSDCVYCSLPAQSVSAHQVDFDVVIPFKNRLLDKAWENFNAGARPDLLPSFEEDCAAHSHWLDDFALFMALKVRHRGAAWQDWPSALVRREPAALAKARSDLAEIQDKFRFGQFLVSRHWHSLREYARGRGVRLLGDLPFYVSPDSSDVWANPELFLLDEQFQPRFVGGVPPDYFSLHGQLWGNPVYGWNALRETGYRWWIARLRAVLNYLDGVRLDHFRAFEAAWHVPAGSATAEAGQWVQGPGAHFFAKASHELGRLPLLAEDLGIITPAVEALRDQFQLPGMRVLQFAFDGSSHNPHLPHHIVHNTVVYTGTHDNDTSRGWYETLPPTQRQVLWNYLHCPPGVSQDVAAELIRLAWSSEAALAIAPFQDLLNLGTDARMNVPGSADGNWRWRFTQDMLSAEIAENLIELTEKSNRRMTMPDRSNSGD
jgi:4-alpha-glucanotransferase